MAFVISKSLSITNLDSSPVIIPTIGEGAPGVVRVINDSVSAVVGDSGGAGQIVNATTASVYRLCRMPTTAKIKQVMLFTNNTGMTGTADLEILFSDSLTDGTQPALSGLINPVVTISGGADNKLFGTAVPLTPVTTRQDLTFKGVTGWLPLHQNLPVWQVLVNLGCTQFSSDPGGFFDLGLKLVTPIGVLGGPISGEVWYVE